MPVRDGSCDDRSRSVIGVWLDRLDWLVLWLGRIGLGIAAGFVGLIFLLLIAGVIARPWTEFVFSFAFETTSMMLWPVAFMGAAGIWRIHGHVRFDLFLRITRGRKHHALELAAGVLAVVVGLLFAWQGWQSLASQFRSGGVTMAYLYPIWPLHSAVFVGGVLLFLELISSVIRSAREVVHPTGVEEATYGAYDDGRDVL